MRSDARGKLPAMLSFGKMKLGLGALILAATLPACATKDGIQTEGTVSTGTIPVAGDVLDAADSVVNEVGNSAVDIATGIVVAPFEVAESFLGIDHQGAPAQTGRSRPMTYEERLALRRSQRGLAKPSATRVKERQAAMRVQFRRPAGF